MGNELVPDDAILSAIFPGCKPTSIEVLANNFDACTFKVKFDEEPSPGLPAVLIVRIETSNGVLETVSALQKVASYQIPEFIAEVYSFGKASTADQRLLEYTITKFIPDTVTLESVWPSLSSAERQSLVNAVVHALGRLQQLKFSDDTVRDLLLNTPYLDGGEKSIGGPATGYAKDIRDFLTQLVERHQLKQLPTSSITENPDGILIESSLSDLGKVFLSNLELQSLHKDALLSHNDLEPRNILVRKLQGKSDNEGSQYELAAIIDWEMAGFLPFAFETAWKDYSLGNANLYYDWYLLFKEKTRCMIPTGDVSEKFIRAVQLIVESKNRQWKRNVSAEFRRRWIQRQGLVLSDKATVGWKRQVSADGGEDVSRLQSLPVPAGVDGAQYSL